MSKTYNFKNSRAVLRIVAIYAFFGSLWIYLSDSILEYLFRDPVIMTRIAIFKGFLFIFLTSLLLYLLIDRYIRQREASEQSFRESEQRFRSIFELAAVGVALVDPRSGGFVRINAKFCIITGYSAEELLGKRFQDITHPDDRQTDLDNTAKLLAGTIKTFTREKRYIHKNGHVVWVNLTVSPLWLDDQEPTCQIAVVEDISERKRIEETLNINKERLKFALSASRMGVWEWNLQTNAVFWSPECYEIVGLKEFNGSFEDFERLLHPDDAAHVMDTVNRALLHKSAYVDEFRIISPDGEQRWLANHGGAIYDDDGAPLRLVGTVQDITERKNSEEALRKNNELLQAAEKELMDKNGELERFTYTVSHDLKSPLITIQCYAGMIKQDLEAGRHARIPDDLDRIADASTKMGLLLDDLLQLSRVGKNMSPPSRFDMGGLVKGVLAQLAGPLRQKNVEITVQSDLPIVHGDQSRIAEVLQNLLENAIKYIGDQVKPRIEICAREEAKEFVFSVSDNGIGIDPRYHQSIFGLFNKLEPKSEGTGIGLAIVKRIVELHGGRIWVESEGAGKGSRFCFALPILPMAE